MSEDITQDLREPIVEPTSIPPSESPAAPVAWGQLGWGVAIMSAGALLLLERFDVLDAEDFWRLAPGILVAFGALALVRGKSAKERQGGWWLLGVGLYLLVNLWEVWNFWWDNSWPLILICIGLAHLFDPASPKDRAKAPWLLGIGTFFLLAQGLFFDLDVDEAWPLLLIAIGVVLTWRALFGDDKSRKAGAP